MPPASPATRSPASGPAQRRLAWRPGSAGHHAGGPSDHPHYDNVDVDAENTSSQTIGTTHFVAKSLKRMMKPTKTRAEFLAGKKQPLKFK